MKIIFNSNSYQLNPVPFNDIRDNMECLRHFELNKLFPFQILLSKTPTKFKVEIVNCSGVVKDITVMLQESGLKLINPGVNKLSLVFPAKFMLNLGLAPDTYKLIIDLGSEVFTSASFRLQESIPELYAKLTWGNNTSGDSIAINGGIISFADDFEYFMYIDLAVTNTETQLTEEVNNRDGVQFPTKMVSELTYNTTDFTADPALIDCLRLVNMCDDISLENKGVKFVIQDILFTPKWRSAGTLIADVSCEFSLGNYIKRIGFDYTKQYQGDFNNDFNNDYKK